MYGSNFGSKFGKCMGQFSFSSRHIPTKKNLSSKTNQIAMVFLLYLPISDTLLRLRQSTVNTYTRVYCDAIKLNESELVDKVHYFVPNSDVQLVNLNITKPSNLPLM